MIRIRALEELARRFLVDEPESRREALREESSRIRSGDPISWLYILCGVVPLTFQNPTLTPLWAGLVVLVVIGRRRAWSIPAGQDNIVALVSAAAAFGLFAVTGEGVWGFATFLIFIAIILLFQGSGAIQVQHLYAVSFVLFIVFAHLTLEYTFLLGLLLMTLTGLTVIVRYHFPGAVGRRRYLDLARGLVPTVALSALVAVPIFVSLPRVPVSLLTIKKPPTTPGFSETIHFGDFGETLQSDRLYMTVRAAEGRRWRGIVLDEYTGRGWTRRARVDTPRRANLGDPIWLHPRLARPSTAGLLEQEIILEPTSCRFLFAAGMPWAVVTDYGDVWAGLAGTMIRPEEPQAKKLRYLVYSGPAPALEPDEFIQARYLQLPDSVPRRVGALARQITAGAVSDRERAERIEFWLRNEFGYTLDTRAPLDQDPVDFFLFEARRGHCEYFSSSMVLMMRFLGIPARIVNGFSPGTHDEIAGTWRVLERNAHSWVEVLLPQADGTRNWVEFDPTSGRDESLAAGLADRLGLSRLRAWKVMTGYVNLLDFEWQRYVISFSSSMQLELYRRIAARLEELEIELRVLWNRLRITARTHALMLSLGTLLALVVFRRRIRTLFLVVDRWARPRLERLRERLRSWLGLLRRRSRPDDDDFYHQMVRMLELRNVEKSPHETGREFLQRVRGRLPAVEETVERLTHLHYRIAYRGLPLTPGEEDLVRIDLEELRRRLMRSGGS